MATDVLLLSEAPIATVQLLERLLAHLEQSTELRTRSRSLADVRGDDLTADTFPLIVRSCHPDALRLTRVLRRLGVAYGFYLDDNFWLLDPQTELGRHYASPPVRRALEEIVRRASVVVAATPLLQTYLRTRNHNVVQLDSFFDFSLVPELPSPPESRASVRGGYAASAHRGADLLPLLDDVMAVLDEHPEFEFEVIGIDEPVPQHPRLRTFGYRQSYEDYVQFQQSRQWDFALAPLGAAASNLYKTDNKYREYAAQGIPGVYQDAPPYASVRDGETGLLAGGKRSWRAAMKRYIDDPALRAAVRRNASLDARERLSIDAIAPQWAAFLRAAPTVGDPPDRLARLRARLDRPPTGFARARLRWRLLWAYGLTQVSQDGLAPTVGRTLRFIARRAFRRTPPP